MKTVTVKNTWLSDSDLRLDASFHLSDGPVTKILLKRSPYSTTTLSIESESIYTGNIFKRVYVDNNISGFPFLTPSDMMKVNIDGNKFVSRKHTKNREKLTIKKDWILVSCSGTLGNTVYTNEDFHNRVATHDLIRIIPNDKNVKRGFLYSYLSSRFGYGLLTQASYGGVVKHIEPHHIQDLPIPILPNDKQEKIHNLILDSAHFREQATVLLNKAIECFEERIGESKIHLGYQHGSISSKALNNFHKRLDSQYQLIWEGLKNEEEKKFKYSKIFNYAQSIFVGGRGKRNYVENGISFLSSSDMMLFNPRRGCKKVSKNNPGLKSMIVNEKDILISRSGTVGNTVLVGKHLAETAISEHALRLVIDSSKINPNYVFCFLKTKYGMRTMEASSFGSVIITLNEDLIGNIKLPILDNESQSKINQYIETYLDNLDKATEYENKAIDTVEKEIESWQN